MWISEYPDTEGLWSGVFLKFNWRKCQGSGICFLETHIQTQLYVHTHILEIITCCVVAFFILAQQTIRGDITASITPATTQPSPHSPHNQLPTIVSMVTGRQSPNPRCRLHEQHTDENQPKAPASHSASAQPEQGRTPWAVHVPVRYNMLYMKFMTCGRETSPWWPVLIMLRRVADQFWIQNRCLDLRQSQKSCLLSSLVLF